MKIKVRTLKKLIESQIALSEAEPTVLDNASSLNMLCQKVEAATDRNDHTGAVIMIASFTKNKEFISLANAIKTIHNLEEHIPHSIIDYRSELTNRMLTFIDTTIEKGASEKINACL